jgi:hypothetical protein
MKDKTIEVNYSILENFIDILTSIVNKDKYIIAVYKYNNTVKNISYFNNNDEYIDQSYLGENYNIVVVNNSCCIETYFKIDANFNDTYYIAVPKNELLNFLKLYSIKDYCERDCYTYYTLQGDLL